MNAKTVVAILTAVVTMAGTVVEILDKNNKD